MEQVLVIGAMGEVGRAIVRVEQEAGHDVGLVDVGLKPDSHDLQEFSVMHVCIPYSDDFVFVVNDYINEYEPEIVIIHSTVKVGTTSEIARISDCGVVHSFVRGVHPNLYSGLKTFVKYVGGDQEHISRVLSHFKKLGLRGRNIGNAEQSELAKILSTTYYGWNIFFAREAKNLCDGLGLDFDMVYTYPNETYNEGYESLGMPWVRRPVLYPPEGVIGGHCVSNNFLLLPRSKLRAVVEELNDYE